MLSSHNPAIFKSALAIRGVASSNLKGGRSLQKAQLWSLRGGAPEIIWAKIMVQLPCSPTCW